MFNPQKLLGGLLRSGAAGGKRGSLLGGRAHAWARRSPARGHRLRRSHGVLSSVRHPAGGRHQDVPFRRRGPLFRHPSRAGQDLDAVLALFAAGRAHAAGCPRTRRRQGRGIASGRFGRIPGRRQRLTNRVAPGDRGLCLKKSNFSKLRCSPAFQLLGPKFRSSVERSQRPRSAAAS